MATAEKHRKRSHYSARNRIPFGLFRKNEKRYGIRLGHGSGILERIRAFIKRLYRPKED